MSGTAPMRNRNNHSIGSSTTTTSSSNGGSGGMYGRNSFDVERGGGGSGRVGSKRGGGGGGGYSASDANANILEQQNNERIDLLSEQVGRLKSLTIDIGNEVREQNSFLDNMGDGFQNTRDLLQGSLTRIGTMLESGGTKHMCYMVLFSVFVMVFLWWLMKFNA